MVPNQKDVSDWFFQEFLSDVTKRQKRQRAKRTKNIFFLFLFFVSAVLSNQVFVLGLFFFLFFFFVSAVLSNQVFVLGLFSTSNKNVLSLSVFVFSAVLSN